MKRTYGVGTCRCGNMFTKMSPIHSSCSERCARERQPLYRERRNRKNRERYATDPEYRAEQLKRTSTPQYRERRNRRNRERYATDPEYRAQYLTPKYRDKEKTRRRKSRLTTKIALEILKELGINIGDMPL